MTVADGAALSVDGVAAGGHSCSRRPASPSRPWWRPPAVEWLDEARGLGLRVGLASSSGAQWVGRFLDALDLRDRFVVLATRDRVVRSKPDPELYELAMRELGVRPEETIAVEDSPNGVAAAKAAGLFCVAVPNPLTAGLALHQADIVLRSLSDRSLTEVAASPGSPGACGV